MRRLFVSGTHLTAKSRQHETAFHGVPYISSLTHSIAGRTCDANSASRACALPLYATTFRCGAQAASSASQFASSDAGATISHGLARRALRPGRPGMRSPVESQRSSDCNLPYLHLQLLGLSKPCSRWSVMRIAGSASISSQQAKEGL